MILFTKKKDELLMHSRPSDHEICRRLQEAKEALRSRKMNFACSSKVRGEISALNLGDSSEVWDLILKVLIEEINVNHYSGRRPPEKAYEKIIETKDLWAFCWYSKILKKKMYLKFAIKNNIFYYVSLHESKYH